MDMVAMDIEGYGYGGHGHHFIWEKGLLNPFVLMLMRVPLLMPLLMVWICGGYKAIGHGYGYGGSDMAMEATDTILAKRSANAEASPKPEAERPSLGKIGILGDLVYMTMEMVMEGWRSVMCLSVGQRYGPFTLANDLQNQPEAKPELTNISNSTLNIAKPSQKLQKNNMRQNPAFTVTLDYIMAMVIWRIHLIHSKKKQQKRSAEPNIWNLWQHSASGLDITGKRISLETVITRTLWTSWECIWPRNGYSPI